MVTPYFSKLCHGHTCLLNAPAPLNSFSQLPELLIKEPRYTKL
ncbi:unnamed protein product [Callosobruchus maculatus]|uniref:Uncharacterized protein n=1 Tax=Callosobruchus maculatus TaxID=64391 RepID=A0A653BZ14_CALMS|nr:unnamed protein product [Callosobruchus maculatus]